jgi:tripartite-type tricarboxylate transporter receptor subunit TctC
MKTICALLALVVAGAAPEVAAQSVKYPVKPVRMIVGFSPGGATDNVARFIAPKLGEGLGQQVVVENRPGASSLIAGELVAKSPPDGYTVFMVTQTIMNAQFLQRKNFPDLTRDFAAVSLVASSPLVLVVNPSLPVKTVKELIALAKARPGELNYGSGGVGASPHMSGELFAKMAGIKLTHVPYKGEGPALVDLIGGHLPMMFSNLTAAMPHVQAGKLRALAVTSAKATPAAPGVPTVAESGLPGFEVLGWFGVVAPAATPREILDRLSSEIRRTLERSDIRELFASQGLTSHGTTPEEYATFIQSEAVKWKKLIDEVGITVK